KEITLRDKASEVAELVNRSRGEAVRARATIGFLGAIPKFVLDSAVIIGFLLVGGIGYAVAGGSFTGALTSVALFGLASFRLVPSMLQFQSVMTSTASTLPHARAVIRDIRDAEGYTTRAVSVGYGELADDPKRLVLSRVSFRYPDAPE